jgi:isopentenyl-diphosphate delta-isomerase type 1
MEPDDEILDLVDEEGRVVGQATRGDCHSDRALLHRAVHLFVFDRRGGIFLQKRSLAKRIQPGRWDTSVGGHVDHGESYETALRREAEEELGLTDVDAEMLHQYVWRSEVESELVRTYRCVHEGPFRLKADEIDEGRFFSSDELRALVGTGQLTPNLEHELELLGIVPVQ